MLVDCALFVALDVFLEWESNMLNYILCVPFFAVLSLADDSFLPAFLTTLLLTPPPDFSFGERRLLSHVATFVGGLIAWQLRAHLSLFFFNCAAAAFSGVVFLVCVAVC